MNTLPPWAATTGCSRTWPIPRALLSRRPLATPRLTTWRKRAGLALLAVVLLALAPREILAGFVGPTAITIDGVFTDWTGNVYSQTDGYTPPGANGATDVTRFWYAMSTANGTSPASSVNLIQNVYFRIDTSNTGANPKHCHPIGFPMKSAFFANFDFLHCLKTRWKSELTQNPL